MSDLIGFIIVIFLMAAEMTLLFVANGGVHVPRNLLDWVCWLLAFVLMGTVAWLSWISLPHVFSLSMPMLLLLTVLVVLFMVGVSFGLGYLSRKYGWF